MVMDNKIKIQTLINKILTMYLIHHNGVWLYKIMNMWNIYNFGIQMEENMQ